MKNMKFFITSGIIFLFSVIYMAFIFGSMNPNTLTFSKVAVVFISCLALGFTTEFVFEDIYEKFISNKAKSLKQMSSKDIIHAAVRRIKSVEEKWTLAVEENSRLKNEITKMKSVNLELVKIVRSQKVRILIAEQKAEQKNQQTLKLNEMIHQYRFEDSKTTQRRGTEAML